MPKKNRHAVKNLTTLTITLTAAFYPYHSLRQEASLPPPPPKPPTPKPSTLPENRPLYEETYYTPSINRMQNKEPTLVLVDRKNNIWINAKDLKNWKLHIASKKPLTWENNTYINVSSLPDTKMKVDTANMALQLNFPMKYFEKSRHDLSTSKIQVFKPPEPGGYINYTLTDTRSNGVDSLNALLEGVIFNRYGAGRSQFFVNNTQQKRFIRLQSTWFHDEPEKMASWRFGDLTSGQSAWSGSVNFGGIQWASNYTTQPQFITFPLPGYHGAAIVPSVLDLYINNSRNKSIQLNPGPYEISNIPVIDGAGNVRIVTTDILGRQQVVTGNYFLNTTILKTGLQNFSYEMGMLRYNLGTYSNKYKQFVISATNQYSPNDLTAIQWHGEALSYEQAAGLAFTRVYPKYNGIFNSSAAISNNSYMGGKKGSQVTIGLSQNNRYSSLGVTAQYTTTYFTDQGIPIGTRPAKLTAQLFGGTQWGQTSLAFNYLHQINREDQPNIDILTATVSRNIFFGITMNLSWQNTIRGSNTGKTVFLSLTRSLDNQTAASYGGTMQTHASYQDIWQLQRSLPQGRGYGYMLSEQRSNTETRLASFSYQNDFATWTAEYTKAPSLRQETYFVSMSGALVRFDGKSIMSRQIPGSFVLVDVKGFDNVTVLSNNQSQGVTNSAGYFVIPNLTAYFPYDIRINANNLPLNTQISGNQATASPYYRAGELVHFEAQTIRSATLSIKQHNGQPIPEGSTIVLDGVKDQFISGDNGEAYVTGIKDENTLHALWETHDCVVKFVAPPPDKNNPIPDLGSFVCTETTTGEKHEEQQ